MKQGVQMRQIVSVARKSEGRPNLLETPEGGWTYALLSELSAGTYHVELGKKIEADADTSEEFPEQDIAAGHTFAILGRSASSWDKQVNSLLKTIDEQGKLITKLYAERSKLLDDKASAPNFMDMLVEFAPVAKKLLAAAAEKEKTTDGNKP